MLKYFDKYSSLIIKNERHRKNNFTVLKIHSSFLYLPDRVNQNGPLARHFYMLFCLLRLAYQTAQLYSPLDIRLLIVFCIVSYIEQGTGCSVNPILHGVGPILHSVDPILHGVGPALHSVDPNLHGVGPVLHSVNPILHGVGPVLHSVNPILHGLGPALHSVDPILHSVDPVLHSVDPILHSVDHILHNVDPILHSIDPIQHSDVRHYPALCRPYLPQ
jgi:hypothetical protein